jgi:protein dithiol oxidoreductase (disulfide-forming)
MDTYNSFALQAMVQRADQIARAYRVQGVPTMAVGGRYMTSASMTGSHENTLKVVDELIVRVRAEGGRS